MREIEFAHKQAVTANIVKRYLEKEFIIYSLARLKYLTFTTIYMPKKDLIRM